MAAQPPQSARPPRRTGTGQGAGRRAPRRSARRCPSECRSGSGPAGRRSGSSVPASGAAWPPGCGPPDRVAHRTLRHRVRTRRSRWSGPSADRRGRPGSPRRCIRGSGGCARKRRSRGSPGYVRAPLARWRRSLSPLGPAAARLRRTAPAIIPANQSATAWTVPVFSVSLNRQFDDIFMTIQIPCNSSARHGSNPGQPRPLRPVASL